MSFYLTLGLCIELHILFVILSESQKADVPPVNKSIVEVICFSSFTQMIYSFKQIAHEQHNTSVYVKVGLPVSRLLDEASTPDGRPVIWGYLPQKL